MLARRPYRDPGREPVIQGVSQPDPVPAEEGVVFIEHSSRKIEKEPEVDPVWLNVSLSTSQP